MKIEAMEMGPSPTQGKFLWMRKLKRQVEKICFYDFVKTRSTLCPLRWHSTTHDIKILLTLNVSNLNSALIIILLSRDNKVWLQEYTNVSPTISIRKKKQTNKKKHFLEWWWDPFYWWDQDGHVLLTCQCPFQLPICFPQPHGSYASFLCLFFPQLNAS